MSSVYWLLKSTGTLASTRLQGTLVNDQLRRRNILSDVLYQPAMSDVSGDIEFPIDLLSVGVKKGDVLVIQKLNGPNTVDLVTSARRLGAFTVYIECDYRPEVSQEYLCDAIVTPSEALARLLEVPLRKVPVYVIPDPVERVGEAKVHRRKDELCVVWIGSKAHWETLDIAREALSAPDLTSFQLHTVSDHPDADEAWSYEDSFRTWASADICVIPTGDGVFASAKSANRVLQSMALGVPVIAGDIPSYRAVVQPGSNGLIARSVSDYRDAFRTLRDPNVRTEFSRNGFTYATEKFSLEKASEAWEELLVQLTGSCTLRDFRWSLRGKLNLLRTCRRARSRVFLDAASCIQSFRPSGWLALRSASIWPPRLPESISVFTCKAAGSTRRRLWRLVDTRWRSSM